MNEFDFNELLQSIKEMKEIMSGKRKPSRKFFVKPLKVKSIRRKLKLSQTKFARLIGVSPATLRNWEQGRTYPEGAARALLQVADKRPDAILEALHAA
jgi:putative transcriptional regulator